jgi:hypothetical protein
MQLPDVEIGEFIPKANQVDDLGLTEIILEDTTIIWRPLPIPAPKLIRWMFGLNGHFVDLGYSTDGRLIGVQIWGKFARISTEAGE